MGVKKTNANWYIFPYCHTTDSFITGIHLSILKFSKDQPSPPKRHSLLKKTPTYNNKKTPISTCYNILILTETSSSSQRSNWALIAESASSGKCLKNLGINWAASLFSLAPPFTPSKIAWYASLCWKRKTRIHKQKNLGIFSRQGKDFFLFHSLQLLNYVQASYKEINLARRPI